MSTKSDVTLTNEQYLLLGVPIVSDDNFATMDNTKSVNNASNGENLLNGLGITYDDDFGSRVNTWISSGSTNGNLGSNWSLGTLSAYDTLYFTSASVVNCTLTSDLNCNQITIDVTYTGTFSDGGKNVTSISTINVNSGGTFTATGTWTVVGDGDLIMNPSGTTSITANVVAQGNGNIVLKSTQALPIQSLTCGNTGKTTILATLNPYIKNLIIGAGTFTQAVSMHMPQTSNGTPIICNGTWIASAFYCQIYISTASNITSTIGAINRSGAAGWLLFNSIVTGIWTINMSADWTINMLDISDNTPLGSIIFNTNNFNITNSVRFSVGSNNATASTTVNFGSSTITTPLYNPNTSVGSTVINLQTSQWIVKGNWTFPANQTVSAGTSLVTFTTNNATVTSNGKEFYDLVFNQATKTWTIADPLSCNNLTITEGIWTNTGTTITSTGNITFNGTGTLNLGNGITLTADGNFYIGSTVGTITSTSLSLDLRGTGTLDSRKLMTFVNLDCAYSGKITNNISLQALTLNNGVLHLHGGTYVDGINYVYMDCTTQVNPIVWDTGSITSGNSYFYIRPKAAISINVPAIRNCYVFGILGNTTAGVTATININGTINISYLLWYQNAVGSLTINTNNNQIIIGGYMIIGNNSSGGTYTFNAGSSIISVGTYFNTYNVGNSTINLQTSQWTVRGNWTYGSNQTITPGTAQITFPTTTVVTTYGKPLPTVNFNNNFTINSISANTNINRLIYGTDGISGTFEANKTFTISALAASDWNGSIGQINTLKSTISGTPFTLAIPNTATMSYVRPKDSTLTGYTILVNDGTSINGGGNIGWIFSAIVSYIDNSMLRGLYRGIGKGM